MQDFSDYHTQAKKTVTAQNSLDLADVYLFQPDNTDV